MVIGGIAVIARGVRQLTTDIDATVRGDQIDVASLLKALAKKRIVFKAIAGRPEDIQDATTLLVLYSEIERARVRNRVRQLAALVEDAAPVNVLEAAIAAAGTVPRLRTSKAPPRRRAPHKRGLGTPRPRKLSVAA